MTSSVVTLESMMQQANQLSPWERMQLAERILQSLRLQWPAAAEARPLRSLYGLWQGFTINDEDLREARQELWGRFSVSA